MRDIPGTQYITRYKNWYLINKWINGKYTYFGRRSSLSGAIEFRDKCIRDGWKKIPTKKIHFKDPKLRYIQRTPCGHYNILRKNTYYGMKESLEEAIEFRDFLEEHDWDINLKQKQRKRGIENKNRYVYKTACGRYAIVKMIQGKLKYFGAFTTLDAAKRERDLLEKYDWDEELLLEIDEQ